LVFDKPSGQWIYEQKKPGPLGAGQTPVDVWKELNKPKTERELTGEAAIQARSLGLPLDPSTWTPEQGAKARAAHLEDILAARPPREGREPPSPTKGKRTFYDAKTGAFLGMFYGTGDQPKGSSPRPPSVIKPSKPTIKVFKETGPDGRGYLVKRRIDRPGSPAVGVDVDPTAETAIGRYFGAAKAPPLSAFPDLPEPGPGSEGAPVDEVP